MRLPNTGTYLIRHIFIAMGMKTSIQLKNNSLVISFFSLLYMFSVLLIEK